MAVGELLVPRLFFFFKDTATTEIYTLSLHDALPIYPAVHDGVAEALAEEEYVLLGARTEALALQLVARSEEHTSELQSRRELVCRLLLEKKKIVTQQKGIGLETLLCCRHEPSPAVAP